MSNPVFTFEEAKRVACKASIMIEGLPGGGKSGLALAVAKALTGDWKTVFDIDTENRSARLFRDIDCSTGETYGPFQVGELTPEVGYKPSNYIAFREEAIRRGAKAVIEDSISHAWQYKGGVLDMVAELKKTNARYQKDSYAAWGDDTVVKEKNELLQLIRDPRVHVITTVRVKEKMEYDKDDTGKTVLVSLGEQQLQQADLKYEPDLVLHMVKPGSNDGGKVQHPVAKVIKTRYAIFKKDQEYEFTPDLMEQLRQYLEEGVDPKELLEKQRLDYVEALKEHLTKNPGAKAIWDVMKKDAGHEETKLKDMPLNVLKSLFIKLID